MSYAERLTDFQKLTLQTGTLHHKRVTERRGGIVYVYYNIWAQGKFGKSYLTEIGPYKYNPLGAEQTRKATLQAAREEMTEAFNELKKFQKEVLTHETIKV